jgi:hypothetical protein
MWVPVREVQDKILLKFILCGPIFKTGQAVNEWDVQKKRVYFFGFKEFDQGELSIPFLKKWKAWNRIKKFLNVMEYKKWLFNRS